MMNITVVGATGLIGKRVTKGLRDLGHNVRGESPSSGVDTFAGEGIDEAVADADVVVDVSNPDYRDAREMVRFFKTAASNLAAAERKARVKHHVLLSAVGARRVESGYFIAKRIQERIVEDSGVPFTIVRSTPFFEYLYAVIDKREEGADLHVPPVLMQPIAADDVAEMISQIATGQRVVPLVEIGGPEVSHLPDLAEEILVANEDQRRVVVDAAARYFGAQMAGESLIAFENARVAPTYFDDWLRQTFFLHQPGRRTEHPHLRVKAVSGGIEMSDKDINPEAKPSGTGCADCLAEGSWWFHLRRCAICGHIGCCDSSPRQHAVAHFHESRHPIIQSFEPGEDWFWDYRTQSLFEGPQLAPPRSRPAFQPAPGPVGAVPADWTRQLHGA